ncbi:MAG TPA: TCR/Tet family MFS transporter [Methylomirabilota bacterium]|nr:TCR/Tet family MFS transporter [Methylomirabilota bacterium]
MSEPKSPATFRPAPAAGAPGPRRAAVAFIFITVLIDVLAIGLIIPVLPRLVEQFMGGDTARAASVFGAFGTAWALMQFLCSPILGSLSDRFGRRSVILLSCLGLGLDYVFMALAPSLGWLFVGRIISGITAASFSTALAYISDVTPPEKRAASFGLMGAAFGMGFVLGPAVGGLLGGLSPRAPFWVSAVLALVNVLYGWFVLPESLSREHRRSFDWKRANPVGALAVLGTRKGLLGLVGIYGLYMLAHQALQSTFVLYAEHRYHWDARTVGLMLAAVGACTIVVQGALVRFAVARMGERRTLLLGLTGGTLGFLGYALAGTGAAIMAVVPVFGIMFFSGPPLQGLMARKVQPNEYGLLQGANASIMGIAGIIGPVLFTQVFAFFLQPHRGLYAPGAPFFLGGVLMATAWILAWNVARVEPGNAGTA